MSLLTVMGDYMSPETLALVSRCSKQSHQSITPLLKIKMENASEMHQMVLRFYPSIFDLPEIHPPEYYLGLINFVTVPVLDLQSLQPYVGLIVLGAETRDALGFVFSAIRCAEGRRHVLRSLRDWRWLSVDPEVHLRINDLRDRVAAVV
jgi:hypothetical protein